MQKCVRIDVVIENARCEMLRLAYSKTTVKNHVGVWNNLLRYAEKRGDANFTAELAEEFLSETLNYPQIYADGKPMAKGTISKIRSIRILQDFHFLGVLPMKLMPSPTGCPELFKDVYEQYREYCSTKGRIEETGAVYARTAMQFTLLLEERGLKGYAEIGEPDVDTFVMLQEGYTKHTVKAKFRTLKTFLRYLHDEGHVAKDFSPRIPHVRTYAKGRIPTTLSNEQTKQLISSFDRGNPLGKRDYAILLVALELGLRGSDISNLRFENIDWVQRCIRIVQDKTQNVLELPMSNRVSNAIIEYLRHGRPKSKASFVFVKHIAPYDQYGDMSKVMRKALSAAGIRMEEGSSNGLHILRHTLGTNLLKNGFSLHRIAEILGQRNIITTEIYAHTDIDGLRKCAIDPEEVLGNG